MNNETNEQASGEARPAKKKSDAMITQIEEALHRADIRFEGVVARRDELSIVLAGKGRQKAQAGAVAAEMQPKLGMRVNVLCEEGAPRVLLRLVGAALAALALLGVGLYAWGFVKDGWGSARFKPPADVAPGDLPTQDPGPG